MAFGKDIERIVRAFVAQKLELEYIRHYLMDTYQIDRTAADVILEKVGVKLPPSGGRTRPGDDRKGPDKNKIGKQKFY
ncbi:MAG: hypothetical protein AAB263_02905 [Planctomycetota bacterium]